MQTLLLQVNGTRELNRRYHFSVSGNFSTEPEGARIVHRVVWLHQPARSQLFLKPFALRDYGLSVTEKVLKIVFSIPISG